MEQSRDSPTQYCKYILRDRLPPGTAFFSFSGSPTCFVPPLLSKLSQAFRNWQFPAIEDMRINPDRGQIRFVLSGPHNMEDYKSSASPADGRSHLPKAHTHRSKMDLLGHKQHSSPSREESSLPYRIIALQHSDR